MFLPFVIFATVGYTLAVEFQIRNNVPGPIWIGILGNGGKSALSNGGFALNQGEEKSVFSSDDWAGRFWARTWCYSDTNHCETGDCGNRYECAGAGGVPPVTLVEIGLRGHGGQDFYDISLVDGFNVPASIGPIGGTGNCPNVACPRDLNPGCPNELKVTGSAGYTIACNSACNKYNTDQYCCRGAYGQASTCNTGNWQVNSARYFKENCPDAYSYAYDDPSSLFTCVSSKYKITFG